MRMTFGKHEGEEVHSLPKDYLQWILRNTNIRDRRLKAEIERVVANQPEPEEIIEALKDQNAELREEIDELVKYAADSVLVVQEFYRKIVRLVHPDRNGGDGRAMQLVNDLKDHFDMPE
jgi:hypothetical protein